VSGILEGPSGQWSVTGGTAAFAGAHGTIKFTTSPSSTATDAIRELDIHVFHTPEAAVSTPSNSSLMSPCLVISRHIQWSHRLIQANNACDVACQIPLSQLYSIQILHLLNWRNVYIGIFLLYILVFIYLFIYLFINLRQFLPPITFATVRFFALHRPKVSIEVQLVRWNDAISRLEWRTHKVLMN
jgi:hypothetical protein